MVTAPVPAMADQEARENPTPPAATPAAAPAATPAAPAATPAPPAAARPKRISHRGRTAGARVSSNQQEGKVEEFEPFMLMPRGPPPLKGEAEKMCTFYLLFHVEDLYIYFFTISHHYYIFTALQNGNRHL